MPDRKGVVVLDVSSMQRPVGRFAVGVTLDRSGGGVNVVFSGRQSIPSFPSRVVTRGLDSRRDLSHFVRVTHIFGCTASFFPHITQATGVVVDDEVASAFQGFKLQSAGHKLRYYIYKIEDKKTIKIEKSADRSKTYEDFCEDLPDNECRYGLIDLEFKTDDGRPTSKLVFITWNPDSGSIRDKMLYSGSKESIKSALSGVGIHINATDQSELDLETSILPVVKKFA